MERNIRTTEHKAGEVLTQSAKFGALTGQSVITCLLCVYPSLQIPIIRLHAFEVRKKSKAKVAFDLPFCFTRLARH